MNIEAAHQVILEHVSRYVHLTEKDTELFLSLLVYRKLPARAYLVHEQSFCQFENFVVAGCLRSFHTDRSGVEHTLHFAIENWWITDSASFLSNSPATRNIVTVEPSELLQISLSSLTKLYEEAPIFERFFRILHQNAAMAQDQRILNTITLDGRERFETFARKYPALLNRLPQKHIASYLGITPVFLSRIRATAAKGNS